MTGPLDGKIALVTGGARAVGRAIALRLAADGALVIINHFRSPADARATKAEIEAAGGRAHIIRASVADAGQRDRMFDEIAATFGALDILVNSAANGRLAAGPAVDEAMIDLAIDTNLKGGLGCSRRARELMRGRAGASIVNISTLGGGQFVLSDYLACGPAKAAVEAMTRYLAVEFAPDGIRVNTAAAGLLESPVAHQFPQAEALRQATVAATPLGRLGTPEELAAIVAFLVSADASWVTGQVLLADGGLSTGAAMLSPPLQPAAPRDDRTESIGTLAAHDTDDLDAEETVVVVGMGITVSGANDPAEFWRELHTGAERFMPVPPDRWDNTNFHDPDPTAADKSYSEHSAFITDFVPHPRLAAELAAAGQTQDQCESTTLWLRNSVLQAMDSVTTRPTDRCGFLVGYTADGNQHAEEATVVAGALRLARNAVRKRGIEHQDEGLAAIEAALRARYPRSVTDPQRVFPHQVGAGAMAGILPADTELLMLDTACSSSLYAVDLGLRGLLDGHYDVAVCGGAFAVGPRGSVLFAKLNGLSARGEVRSFDRTSDGVLFSDGAATVVLKTLRRARADGDRILGVLRGFGASSDGRGKAIYAPNADGQELAIRRAQARPTMRGVRPGWVLAHATGTQAGDSAEFGTLRKTLAGSEPVRVTSNKSVIGHTGWAAGTVSLVQALLGFSNELIPPQHRFDQPPAEFMIDGSNLEIPKAAVRWPAGGDKPRVAAVSSFGFGGTNAHLVVEEPPTVDWRGRGVPTPRSQLQAAPARLAVVAVAAQLPGTTRPHEWLAAEHPVTTFGARYPLPSVAEVKLPPGLLRAIDRCQLMILACARAIHADLGAFWTANSAETGVIVGHFGETHNAMHYATRSYLDDVAATLRADPALARAPWLHDLIADLTAEVDALVPPATENTFPGMMPNVIPARVANYFGLNGLNMTVDTGFTAALSAVDVAARYLRSGELRMALVGGINGNSTEEQRTLLGALLPDAARLAEGAFLLALTTEQTARESSLRVLGYLDPLTAAAARGSAEEIECGAPQSDSRPNLLGAEGALGILTALDTVGADRSVMVRCRGGNGGADAAIRVTGPEFREEAGTAAAPAVSVGERDATVPVGETVTLPVESATDMPENRGGDTISDSRVDVHTWALTADPGVAVRPPIEFLPEAATLLLIDDPRALRGHVIPRRTTVLSLQQGDGVVWVPRVTPEAVGELLERLDPRGEVRHLRLVVDLSADVGTERTETLRALHDLWFLAARQRAAALAKPESSTVALLLRAMDGTAPRPYTGLFTGAIKVAALEWPRSAVFALASDGDLPAAIDLVASESMLSRSLPVAYYRDAVRYRATLTVSADSNPDGYRLTRDSVVVAAGGGRGITAEVLLGLARGSGGRFYILGSSDLDALPARYRDCDDAEFAGARKEYLRRRRAEDPTVAPRVLNAEFERFANARRTARTLRRLEEAGATSVAYLSCDVEDPAAVERAMACVHAAEDRIDLLINAAGRNRSAPIATKDFDEFRRVRDLKLLAYTNLVAALAGRPPRRWCNFGSLLGVTGQVGEVDYASANDFLGTAAVAGAAAGRDELTIGWTLWGEVGLGANPLTKAYFDKTGQYSNMSTAEGIQHFLGQVRAAHPHPYTAHLGVAEYGAVDALLPGFLGPSPRPFYLDRQVAAGQVDGRPWAVHERDFDLDRDAYLADHLVNGVATLPGAFAAELALQAATALLPGWRGYAMEELTFHHFLKVHRPDRPVRKRIRAELLDERTDPAHARVRVEVTEDVIAPNGTVLVRDRPHVSVIVLLAPTLSPAPRWTPWYPATEQPVVDPYHRADAPIRLTGVFETTSNPRLHPLGKRSTYCLELAPSHPVFSRFRVPVLLIDGLLRTGVLAAGDELDRAPVAAPLRIARLDLYEYTNDARLGDGGPIELYAMVPDTATAGDGAGNLFVAVRPDGRIILALKGLEAITTGLARVAVEGDD